ncbi:FkbM family methyltransferase [Acidimicrobiia bacterium]|nr:FkbM family methyltransferase [Acidimicrobiia bacterium]
MDTLNKLLQDILSFIGLGVVKKERLKKLKKDEKSLFDLKMNINSIKNKIEAAKKDNHDFEYLNLLLSQIYKNLKHLDSKDSDLSKFSDIKPRYIDALSYLLRDIDKSIIFDVGAHTGQTLDFYTQVFKNFEIYSFEPFYESYKVLNKKSKNYPFANSYNIGMSDKREEAKFYSYIGPNNNDYSQMNSLFKQKEKSLGEWGFEETKETKEEICKFETLDNFCKNSSITHIDLLKIDVQGAEYKVLKGGINLLKNKKVKIVILEIIVVSNYDDLWKISDYINYFEKLDYELYGLYNFSYGIKNNLLQLDAVFNLKK